MTDLEKKILATIEQRGLKPRPYAYFLAKRSVFRTLACLSVLLGSISVAVLIFAVNDYLATGGRGFDDMPLDDVFEYLPYVWLITIVALVASAYLSLRQMPNAYRYKTWQILIAVLGVCILGGSALHFADAGRIVHEFISRQSSFYEGLTRSPAKSPPTPGKGSLTGTVQSFDGKSILTLQDFTGATWSVDVTGAKIALDDPLGGKEDVEISGVQTGAHSFRAYSVKDWD